MFPDVYSELHCELGTFVDPGGASDRRSASADRVGNRCELLSPHSRSWWYEWNPRRKCGQVLEACGRAGVPLTFRAAGTSLSGQAISDSVLVQLSTAWNGMRRSNPGGAHHVRSGRRRRTAGVRRFCAGRARPGLHQRRKIGGIAANNASGMCCGTAQNSYRTVAAMRVMLADGGVLDTGTRRTGRFPGCARCDTGRKLRRAATRGPRHPRARLRASAASTAIKNTTGYSLNALVDFPDPIDILEHLMIGSEGTLGFITAITYRSVPSRR